ncbi:sugar diacid recognition domain-containing protein [Psychrobacillus soli]|uniref:Transcriptional regulator n=1 Tax=Psychrobacillus soli TaxID=1543965 RepID=A0A544T8E5_9BACI|nr:sugar diacid recognition domain-containing protein [Psychrobacillus soli]TQR13736.1 transcriptional regulator [Psychrobacillus soli]
MILKQIAQKISEDTTKIIGYPVSISDENGILIGVTDPKRLGIFDKLLEGVIKTKELTYYSEKDVSNLPNIFPGVAIPIILNGEVLGAVGIVGKVEEDSETYNYIQLVKNHIEMVCHEALRKEMKSIETSNLNTLIHHILHFDKSTSSMEYIIDYGKMLGFNLSLNRICIMIEVKSLSIDNVDRPTLQQIQVELVEYLHRLFHEDQESLIGSLHFDQFTVLKTVPCHQTYETFMKEIGDKTKKLTQHLASKYQLSTIIAVGDFHTGIKGVKDSYHNALKTLSAGKKISGEDNVFHYEDLSIKFEMLLNDLSTNSFEELNEKFSCLMEHENYETLSSTFLVYCTCKMNVSEAARHLYIHRNSLIYRLEKIHELTKLDLNNFDHCLLLYITVKKRQSNSFSSKGL